MKIVNHCTNSPVGLEWQLRRSLCWIGQGDLVGLASLRLNDEMPEVKKTDTAALWSKRAQAEGAPVYGWYAPPKADAPAYIMLYVRQIYRGVPPFLWWSTVPTLRIVRTLAHEVAHHLIATRGYVFQKKEDTQDEESLANRYAVSILHKMSTQWHYKLGQWFLKEIAAWHYAFGNVDWRAKKYKAAANHFLNAWDLDPEHKDAAYWYWRAKDMYSPKEK